MLNKISGSVLCVTLLDISCLDPAGPHDVPLEYQVVSTITEMIIIMQSFLLNRFGGSRAGAAAHELRVTTRILKQSALGHFVTSFFKRLCCRRSERASKKNKKESIRTEGTL
ncbi:uncharacterized protein BDV14DRAFT_184581, partial [Aspergillus stella-maris]|uniref:uncharacterized protein n=1 Tax=Aspergillus stella-maris TaxID=1810926 RepID=UPI003CCDCB24